MLMLFSHTTKLSVVIHRCGKCLNWVVGLKRMLYFTLSSFELICWTVFDITILLKKLFPEHEIFIGTIPKWHFSILPDFNCCHL